MHFQRTEFLLEAIPLLHQITWPGQRKVLSYIVMSMMLHYLRVMREVRRYEETVVTL